MKYLLLKIINKKIIITNILYHVSIKSQMKKKKIIKKKQIIKRKKIGRDYSCEFRYKNNSNIDNNINNNSNNKKYKKNLFQIKPKRTITNAFAQRNNIENKNNFQTITERGFNDSISENKYKKNLEKHFTIKTKKNNKNLKPIKENTEFMINKYNMTNKNNNKIKEKDGQLKIDELMRRMKMRVIKNITERPQKSKEVSYDNFSKDKMYYLFTDKEKDKINKTNAKYKYYK